MVLVSLVTLAFAATIEVFPGDDLVARTAALQPGDEVIVHGGSYPISQRLVWTVLATEAAPVRIHAAADASSAAERPVITLIPGEDGGYDYHMLAIAGSTFLEVEGLTFQGGADWQAHEFGGVQIDASSDVTLRDVEIAQTGGTALYLSGDNQRLTLDRLHLRDTANGHGLYVGCYDASCWTSDSSLSSSWIHGIGGLDSYAVYLSHGTQGFSLTDSVIHGVENRGVYLGSTEYGPENVAEGNALWDITNRGFYVQGAALVRNNVLFAIDEVGIYTSDPERGTFQDIRITFNTVVDTGLQAVYLNGGWPWASGMVLASNALCNPVGYGLRVEYGDIDTGWTGDAWIAGNVACGLVEGLPDETGVAPGAGYADFSDAAGWDFYPASADATLVNAADPSGEGWIPALDFNGAPRSGDSPDAGAYEWDGGGNPGWQIQEGFKDLGVEARDAGEEVGGCCADGEDRSAQALLALPLALLGLRRRRKT